MANHDTGVNKKIDMNIGFNDEHYQAVGLHLTEANRHFDPSFYTGIVVCHALVAGILCLQDSIERLDISGLSLRSVGDCFHHRRNEYLAGGRGQSSGKFEK